MTFKYKVRAQKAEKAFKTSQHVTKYVELLAAAERGPCIFRGAQKAN